MQMKQRFLYFLLSLTLLACNNPARQNQDNQLSLAQSADAFLNTLSEPQRDQAVFPFDSAERYNWHFVPRDRKGLAVRDMDSLQQEAAFALLRFTLSEQGYRKAKGIMELDAVLKELENRGPDDDYRDPEKYYFSIFGEPSAEKPWGWRIEGHHLSINYTSVDDQLASVTPEFMGANPAIVPSGPSKGKQVLRDETELAFRLLHSLDVVQLEKALISEDAPGDILTGNQRDAWLENPEGIFFAELNSTQQELFRDLLNVYIGNFREEFSEDMMKRLEEAGLDSLRFAWAGRQQAGPGNPHYYRIHGPVLLIEYDNTQNNANHIHTVVRDLTNDFGEDALKRHYEQGHSHGDHTHGDSGHGAHAH